MDIYRKFITVDPHPSSYFVVTLVVYLAHRTTANPPSRIQNDDANHPRLDFYPTFLTYPPPREKNPLIYSTLFAHLPCVPRPPVLPFRLRYLVLS